MGRSSRNGGSGGGGSSSTDGNTDSDEQTSVEDYKKEESRDGGKGGGAVAGVAGSGAVAGAGAGAAVGSGSSIIPDSGGEDNGEKDEEGEDEKGVQADPEVDFDYSDGDSSDSDPEKTEDWESDEEIDKKSEEEEKEQEDEKEDQNDEEDEEVEATVTVRTDPWDNVGWGLKPVIRKLRERYGNQIEVEYKMIPVREFEEAEQFREKWERNSERHGMPVNLSVWDENPPDSTAKSNKAFKIAKRLNPDKCEDFLHKMWMNSVVKGRNIEDREILLDLASKVGYGAKRFGSLWDDVEPEYGRVRAVPETSIETDNPRTPIDPPYTQTGYFDTEDIELLFIGFDEHPLPSVVEFVDSSPPVATREVEVVCEGEKERVIAKLRENKRVEEIEIEAGYFWTTD